MKQTDLLLADAETAAPQAAWLRIDGVSKRFGGAVVLDHIDLSVRRGEFLCLLGPSGCGKTTLLRVIAGLEAQDGGTVVMGGRDIGALPPAQRDYGIVFQSYALFPNLTVAENVAYGLRLPRRERAARVEQLLQMVELDGRQEQYPAQLSGGQQQRVALARAMATSPSLLLLDEPLSALDARVRDSLRQQLKALQRRLGVTAIMVTHDQEEALALADTIAVMSAGRVEQVGTPEQVYREPASRFVAEFIGCANWLPVRQDDEGVVRSGDLSFGRSLPTGVPAATAFCRPEDIRVEPHWSAGGSMTMAIVERVDFLGGVRRAVLSLAADRDALLTVDVSRNDPGYALLVPGARVPVSIAPHAVRYFVDGAA
ncbi:putative 2-aminoethylphosphonate ABC transporter ATP-binding protein [Pseudoduganella umbonata]|uniref:2-aminoethylphosphonate ABC transporter ATP-binding protein n=1 Tax=Pseudoduganella umbonata TaxID=864828 RepID=A0A4P8HXK4_9BURK|nr:putative 2-aminoethylphosphonate ABC transporter ATP-binding protein [Pseudoduganella umbonata]MBB3223450.1 iron(III) transport system ATP-binding protein [Pseudoduganella umbonata]QCP13658.1 putative 2-aminoethylphosphonate ABC transporter ATP-binding protein [Pseudoduganella umbonata]